LAAEHDLLASAKKLTLFAAGAATQRFSTKLADEQEVMGALADMITEVLTMESAILRGEKITANGSPAAAAIAVALARLYAAKSMDRVELAARKVLAAAAEGDALRAQMAILRRLAKHDPADTIALGREVAGHMVKAGRYSI
jgi:butyryl-CoA dehydrogenase